MNVFNQIKTYSKRPKIYEGGTLKLWEDEHISKGMLESHLSPDADGASRKHAFIEASVNWIEQTVPPHAYPKLIDFGCGPGMYTSRLAKKGYDVTGLDISKRSIAYAIDQASASSLNIDYRVVNYLEFDEVEKYDVAILIYYDYGALSDEGRNKVLTNIYRALKPGGKLIFDVLTPKHFEGKPESTDWYVSEKQGFFKETEHICLESHLIYNDNLRLDQYLIIDSYDQVDVVRSWDYCFTPDILLNEARPIGFKQIAYYSDVTGKPFDDTSKSLCMVLEK